MSIPKPKGVKKRGWMKQYATISSNRFFLFNVSEKGLIAQVPTFYIDLKDPNFSAEKAHQQVIYLNFTEGIRASRLNPVDALGRF